jgi:hypothetical protein
MWLHKSTWPESSNRYTEKTVYKQIPLSRIRAWDYTLLGAKHCYPQHAKQLEMTD